MKWWVGSLERKRNDCYMLSEWKSPRQVPVCSVWEGFSEEGGFMCISNEHRMCQESHQKRLGSLEKARQAGDVLAQ